MKNSININRLWLVLIVLLGGIARPAAQNTAAGKQVLQLLQQVKDRYMHVKGLGMTLHYYYANEGTPGKYLDSLQGSMVMNEGDYGVKMQNVETTVNSRYHITLFEDDHLIYLSRPAGVQTYNPVAVMDSLLARTQGVQCSITWHSTIAEVVILFPPQQAYKSMKFIVDTASGYLLLSNVVLKTEYMTAGAEEASLKQQGYDAYAIVEVKYTDYRQEVLPADYFSETRFFTKKDHEFVVTDRYRDYKIFVATPNL